MEGAIEGVFLDFELDDLEREGYGKYLPQKVHERLKFLRSKVQVAKPA